jgi:hypothetical protein
MPIWVNFGVSFAMKVVFKFYGHFVYFTAIWYILGQFGIFCGYFGIFPVLVCCTKKNLATLCFNEINLYFWSIVGILFVLQTDKKYLGMYICMYSRVL